MKVIKPFGPTIGITKLTKTTVTKLNRFSEKVVSNSRLTKKYDFDSQLIGFEPNKVEFEKIWSAGNQRWKYKL